MTSTTSFPSHQSKKQQTEKRQKLVHEAIAAIQQLHREKGINRRSLAETAQILESLASHADLFTHDDFPPPASGTGSSRYALHAEPDQSYALYVNSQHPGKNSVPHDHKTWAVIVAIQGQELNRIYRRLDDGKTDGIARLEIEREVVVQSGTPIAFLGDDIHSIHVSGDTPTLHFHLYGKALETLTERVAYDLENNTYTPYNKSFWRPNAA